MKPLDRLIILFSSIMVVIAGLAISLFALGWDPMNSLFSVVTFLLKHRIESGVAGLILLLAGWHLIFFSVAPTEEHGIMRETALGQVRIQYRAIENLVVRTAQQVEGVRDVEAHIASQGEGVEIRVSLNVLPEYSIPELSDAAQALIAESVQQVAGIDVATVAVEVRNVVGHAKTPRARVE